MTDNKCGTCTACCRVYAIPEFDKPAGVWCTHCEIGKSCKIYATRPTRCVAFECMWLQSQSRTGEQKLEPELRPDRCKVVFAPSTNDQVMTAITMPGMPDAWRNSAARNLIERIRKSGLAVAIGPPAAKTQLLLKADGSEVVVSMTEPDKDGMQWSQGRV